MKWLIIFSSSLLACILAFFFLFSENFKKPGFASEKDYQMKVNWAKVINALQKKMNGEEIKKLGLDVNAHWNEKRPIHWAVTMKNKSGIKALIEAGANLNAINKHKENVLHLAVNAVITDKKVLRSLISERWEEFNWERQMGQ